MAPFDTCSLCPRLCRSACPVATGSGREAAVPTWIATVLRDWERGDVSDELARSASTLCVDCGACREHCHLDRPLPASLAAVRARLLPAPPLPTLPAVPEGEGTLVVTSDPRDIGPALRRLISPDVRVWRVPDGLGTERLDHGLPQAHVSEVQRACRGVSVLVCSGAIAEVLDACGISYAWLHERIAVEVACGSCRAGGPRGLACCGAAGPLPRYHEDDANRVGRLFAARSSPGTLSDLRCARHLRRAGVPVRDILDLVLESQ